MLYEISLEAGEFSRPKHSPKQGLLAAPVEQWHDNLLVELQPILDGLSLKLADGDSHLREDLSQVGAIAAFRAMQRFNPNKGILAHYAVCSAKGAMLHHRRWQRKFIREISFADLGTEAESEQDLPQSHDLLFRDDSAHDRLIGSVDGVFLRELARSVLTARERDVILLTFFEGHLPGEVAHILGVSAARVTQLLQSALTRLRTHLTPEECEFN